MTNIFQFKQFSVSQDKCAMKVGTDGVLLGAWANFNDGDVLDVGAGTGVVALMAAQKNKNSQIDAIDVDSLAVNQSRVNFLNAPWKERLNVFHVALQDFFPGKQYDSIVSNPPFFNNTYRAKNKERNIARHSELLTFEELIKDVDRLLKNSGNFSVILPFPANEFEQLAANHHLWVKTKTIVYPNLSRPPKRVLMEFVKQKTKVVENKLTIEKLQRHDYTNEYKALTKDFYLNF